MIGQLGILQHNDSKSDDPTLRFFVCNFVLLLLRFHHYVFLSMQIFTFLALGSFEIYFPFSPYFYFIQKTKQKTRIIFTALSDKNRYKILKIA